MAVRGVKNNRLRQEGDLRGWSLVPSSLGGRANEELRRVELYDVGEEAGWTVRVQEEGGVYGR